MKYYLYKITNLLNGKIYIGVHQTTNLEDGYMGSGILITKAIHKHGIENFKKDILEFFDTVDDMYARENEIVNEEFLLHEDNYNLNLGGTGGWHYVNQIGANAHGRGGLSGESHQYYGKSRVEYSGEKHPFYGKRRPEHSDKMTGDGNPMYGNHHTEYTKRKISKANTGRRYSNEVNMKKARYGELNHFSVCGYVSVYDLVEDKVCRIPRELFLNDNKVRYVGVRSKLAKGKIKNESNGQ